MKRELKKIREALEAAIDHTCPGEGEVYGWLPCCSVRYFSEHKKSCIFKKALEALIKLEKLVGLK